MKAKQRDFFEGQREHAPRRIQHGGDASKGKRKLNRPLEPRKPIHVVMKASVAKGKLTMLGLNELAVERIVRERADQFGVTIHGYENVGNHLHVVARFKKREHFQNFLRTISALIARLVTKAKKGNPFGKFWDHPAFTRIMSGRRDFFGMKNYLYKNKLQREFGNQARKEYEAAEERAKQTGIFEFTDPG